MSLPEVLLWTRIRQREPGRPIFRRQHPFGPYILDFYCEAARLCVEVDGAYAHEAGNNPARDVSRQSYLEAEGLRLSRFSAAAVLQDPDGAADAITRAAGPG